MNNDWMVELNGVRLGGCDEDDALGMLSYPPDGLGLPEIRDEDVTYPQRDGVRHFSDWYQPRIITLDEVTVCPDDCADCSARPKVRDVVKAWSRQCDDVELVIRTDCDPGPEADRVNLAVTPQPNPDWADTPPTPSVISGIYPRPDVSSQSGVPTQNPTYSLFSLGEAPEPGLTAYWTVHHDPSGNIQQFGPISGIPAQYQGQTGVVSVWVRATTSGVSIPWTVYTVSGGTPVTWESQTVPLTPNVWTKLSATGVLGEGLVVVLTFTSTGGVSSLDVTGYLIEPGTSTPGAYFDGSTDAESSWTGDPGGALGSYAGTGEAYSSTSVIGPDRSLVGPFGIIGRPRVVNMAWERNATGCATLTLRFDAVDQRMYVLDGSGTPGSGVRTVTVHPTTSTVCRVYPKCYPRCYDQSSGEDGGSATAIVVGTECVTPVVCFYGQLTQPRLENVATGEFLGYAGVIAADAEPVCVNTDDGTAEQGGASRTHLVTGNPRWFLSPGDNLLRMVSQSSSDDGYVTVEYRSVVVSG